MSKLSKASLLIAMVFTLIFAYSYSRSATASERIPVVGKRVYIIEKDGSAKIEASGAHQSSEHTITLKDPTLEKNKIGFEKNKIEAPAAPLKKLSSHPESKGKVVVKRPSTIRNQASILSFKRSRIKGNLREPRVKFARNELSVGRRDEPIKRDFFLKVFEDLNDFEN